MTMILFSATIGPVPVDVILKEKHSSKVTVTEIAIETGAKITDHAHVNPKKHELEFASSTAAETWNALVKFQESRVPFTAVSGLFVYTNMLITDLDAERDQKTSKVLKGTAVLQEAVLVETAVSSANDSSNDGKSDKNKSKSVSKDKAKGDAKDKASGTVGRGDSPAKTVPVERNQSIMNKVFGGGSSSGNISGGRGTGVGGAS
jgi:hypothetical protein